MHESVYSAMFLYVFGIRSVIAIVRIGQQDTAQRITRTLVSVMPLYTYLKD